jgi:LL-diaminopimelate aminotransferase
MIGWRIGWVCGHERIVSAYGNVKDNFDSGQFIAIQKAAIAGLDDPAIPKHTRTKYERRLKKLVATLQRCGFKCQMPGGTYFLYAPSPKAFANGAAGGGRIDFENAEAASQYLITEQSICTVPWDDAGPFLRFSATYEAANEVAEDALMAETEARLKNIQPVF